MNRLFLIDQSLKGEGGHHFDYSVLIANTAAQTNTKVVLATHRKFRGSQLLPKDCEVRPVFKNTTYHELSHFEDVGSRLDRGETNPLEITTQTLKVRQRKQAVSSQFERDLNKLFANFIFDVDDKDQVFLTTINELEFCGLANFLENNPATQIATWNVQFHYSLFVGRDSEHENQTEFAAEAIRRIKQSASKLHSHRIKLFNTSKTLVEQYNKLRIGKFSELTYPINPQFTFSPKSNISGSKLADPIAPTLQKPLRITIAGGIRKEKGQHQLKHLFEECKDLFESKQTQLVVQRKKRASWRKPQLSERDLISKESLNRFEHPISWAQYPLSRDEYTQLIHNTSIGLLLYDSRTYFSRRAGILGEYLAAGKPVIVPAGCWLSDQIDEQNLLYSHALLQDRNPQPIQLEPKSQSKFTCEIPEGNRVLFVRFKPSHCSANLERYVKVGLRLQHEGGGTYTESRILRFEADNFTVLHFDLPETVKPNTGNAEIEIRPAYCETPLPLASDQVEAFSDSATKTRAVGSVGLSFADPSEIGTKVRQIVEHYEHYKAHAERFAEQWFARHDPCKTLRQIANAKQEISLRPAA